MIILIVLAIFFSAIGALVAIKYNMFDTEPLEPLQEPPQAPTSPVVPEVKEVPMKPQELLLDAAQNSLGKRMIITPGVPNLLGCASSLSGVLDAAGYKCLPKNGIAGTAALCAFMKKSNDFEEIDALEPGAILIYPSGQPGAVLEHGHVWVIEDEHTFYSNNSETGLWDNVWNWKRAHDYYHVYGKLNGYFFRLIKI